MLLKKRKNLKNGGVVMATTIRDYFKIELRHKTLAQEACVWLGFAFLAVGIIGYVVQSMQSMIDTTHINRTHDVMRAVFGALALEMGMTKYSVIAERFSLWGGLFLGISGVFGFIIGQPVKNAVLFNFPSLGMEHFFVRINLLNIQFVTIDHVLHLFAGAVLLVSVLPRLRAR